MGGIQPSCPSHALGQALTTQIAPRCFVLRGDMSPAEDPLDGVHGGGMPGAA